MSKRAPMQKRAERTRAKIMEAGARLISADGYHATSSKKIAREAGIAVGSFYNHFTDKKDLLLAIYREHMQQVHGMIFETLRESGFARGDADGRETVQQIIAQTLRLHTLSPAFHRQMSALRYTDEEIGRMIAEQEEQVVQMLVQLLGSGKEALRVDDLEAAVRVVTRAIEEVVHEIKIFSPPPLEEERLLAALTDMVQRFLFAGDGARK